MVRANLDELQNKITKWDDNYLIKEATVNIDTYSDEVKNLILQEFHSRNMDLNIVESIKETTISDNNKAYSQKYYGIKGWLLFFVIMSFLGINRILISCIQCLTQSNPDYLSFVVDFSRMGLLLIAIIFIFLRKKSSILLLKIFFAVTIVASIITLITNIADKNVTLIIYSLTMILSSLIWFTYFVSSKRIKMTLVK